MAMGNYILAANPALALQLQALLGR
jgi:hypothetical protein